MLSLTAGLRRVFQWALSGWLRPSYRRVDRFFKDACKTHCLRVRNTPHKRRSTAATKKFILRRFDSSLPAFFWSEDNSTLRNLLQRTLARSGFSVLSASYGAGTALVPPARWGNRSYGEGYRHAPAQQPSDDEANSCGSPKDEVLVYHRLC
jgi:hypothetical protein